MLINQRIKDLNIVSLKTRSLFTLMALSLFAISFTMISDAQTAYGIEVFPLQEILTESTFGDIGIIDVKATENGIYLLYWDEDISDNIKFTRSVDGGVTWSTPALLGGGLDSTFTQIVSQRIFINDNGDIGVSWEEPEGIVLYFAVSTDNGLNFTVFEEVFESGLSASEIIWSGDGQNIASTFSDGGALEFQAVLVSNDFGTSWTEIILQNFDDDGVSDQTQGLIVVNGMNMYASWIGSNSETHVYFSNSNDNGVNWSVPTQISTSSISEDDLQMVVNDNASKVLISWIGDTQESVQAVSTDGGNTFGSPSVLDDGSECDDPYDIDNLGDDAVFMCLGLNDSERHVKFSNDFGQTYSLNYTIFGSVIPISSNSFSENIGTGDNLYSIWEDSVS